MAYNLDNSPSDQLALLMRSGHSLIVIETHEERRAIQLVLDAARYVRGQRWAWSMVRGLVPLDRNPAPPQTSTTQPDDALLQLFELDTPWIAVFADLHHHFKEPRVIRAVREAAEHAQRHDCTLILIGPTINLPAELQRWAFPFPLPLPDTDFFAKLVKKTFRELAKSDKNISHELRAEDLDRLTESLIGLTENEARRILQRVILEDGWLDAHDIERVRQAKRTTIASQGQLEVLPVADDLDALGGLDKLKQWLRRRGQAMSAKGRHFGIDPPRGVLLLGVPGCGKSFCARLVAGEWRRPLLRLDVGGLYNRFVGNTEANLREALRQADAMEPCILWIDEIEKAFASQGSGDTDGGVSQRLFATMLTWMNDRKTDVFIIATANQVHQLPTELMRKGRFDEIFFVDLPELEARKRIFEIHLQRRNRAVSDFDIDFLAMRCEGYSGAEIEQLIVEGLHLAFANDEQLTTDHIAQAANETHPMAITMGPRIESMRQWAHDRCTLAHQP